MCDSKSHQIGELYKDNEGQKSLYGNAEVNISRLNQQISEQKAYF